MLTKALCSVDAGFDEHDIPMDVIWLDIEHTDKKKLDRHCLYYICDQICQKGSYTHTVSNLTFHHHSTDATID